MKKLLSILLVAMLCLTMSNYSFSQNVNVTPSPPGTPYATLTDAFTAVQLGTHGTTPTITFVADYIDATGATLGIGAYTSVTITASGTRNITCSAAAPLITFNNVDNSLIDGNLGGGSLTFTLTNLASTLIGGVNLSNGSSGNTIRDMAVTTASLNGRLINIAQSTVNGAGNNNNRVENCDLNGGTRSLQVFGTALAAGVGSRNLNTEFINNRCLNAATLAIFLGSESENVVCDDNTVDYTGPIGHAALVNWRGINCQSLGTIQIRRNIIKNFKSAFATSTAIGIISIPQITTNPEPTGPVITTINFINNCVTLTDINITGATFVYGIAPLSNPTTVAYTSNVFNNTCRIGGTSAGVAAYTVALAIDAEVAGSVINSSNNICSNTRTGGITGTFHVGYDLTAYPFAGVVLNSDYNLGNASDATFGWDAGYDGFVYKGGFLSTYKDSTCGANIEQHTSNDPVSFTDINSCVFTAGSVGGNMNGQPKAAVVADIFGTPRNATYPYKGAYEGAALKVLTLNGCLEGKISTSEIQIFLSTGAGCVLEAQSFADLDNNTNTATLCYGDAIDNGTAYRLDVRSINHIATYSLATVTFAAGTASYNFPVSGAFGGNLNGSGCFYAGDRNQDSLVDLTDIIDVYTDAQAFLVGCRLASDMNGDGSATLTDLLLTYTSAISFVEVESPCPPEPNSINGSNNEYLRRNESRISKVDSKANVPINY